MPLTSEQILDRLIAIQEFASVPKSQVEWLLAESEMLELKEGSFLFEPGDSINATQIVIDGEIQLYIFQNGNKRLYNNYQTGGIIGYLPYSRAQTAAGYGQALKDSLILKFPKTKIQKLINECPELTEELVHFMISRVRDFTSQNLQNEKMLSLGKLSAGLAHELNNPISAINRDASELREVFGKEELNRLVLQCVGLSEADFSKFLGELESWKNPENIPPLKPLERARLEQEWEAELESCGALESDVLAETFAEFGLKPEQLDQWLKKVSSDQKVLFMRWIHFSLETQGLISNIHSASTRVNALISAVKSYTHMDRAPEKQELDLYESLRDTLTILGHKIKTNHVEITFPKPESPIKICGFVGQLNQVWTNLIDNALDAMENSEQAELRITLSAGAAHSCISFTDNGMGIAEKDLAKIFDPFFTTKAVGKGSGMGLDLVNQIIQKHQGKISVESNPGHTEFKVTLPTT